jgi:DNA-binding transcriptional regulator YhcF (GntR family)
VTGELTASDRAVLGTLGSFAFNSPWAWPSQQTLADVTGLSRRTVIRAVQSLERAGHLVVVRGPVRVLRARAARRRAQAEPRRRPPE